MEFHSQNSTRIMESSAKYMGFQQAFASTVVGKCPNWTSPSYWELNIISGRYLTCAPRNKSCSINNWKSASPNLYLHHKHIHVSICTYICIYLNVCIYMYIIIYIYYATYLCIYLCMHVCMYVYHVYINYIYKMIYYVYDIYTCWISPWWRTSLPTPHTAAGPSIWAPPHTCSANGPATVIYGDSREWE